MELKTYLEILQRRWKIALAVFVVISILAALASLAISPNYQAQAMLRVVTPLGGSSSDINYQTTFATRLINTYAQIAMSEQLNEKLKQALELKTLPEISVKVIPDSEILQVIVESKDPALAAKTANELTSLLLAYRDGASSSLDANALNILNTRRDEIQSDLTKYSQQYNELAKSYSQTAADLAVLQGTIQLKESTYQSLQSQYDQTVVENAVFGNSATRVRIAALNAQIEQTGKELDGLNKQNKELSTQANQSVQDLALLRQSMQNTQSAYYSLRYQYDNVSLANSLQKNAQNVEVVSPASMPTRPSSPGGIFVVGLGLICGLIMGILVAFLFDNLDDRIFSLEQIGRVISAPLIGNIPQFDPQEVEKDPMVQREYWLMRGRLQKLVHDDALKTLMITSPNGMEGKSTIVFRLAMGLAQNELKVLLVDADLRLPQQLKLFHMTAEHGLGDFLRGKEEDPRRMILKGVRPGLDLLPSQAEMEDPIELLESPRWKKLSETFKSYDVVLFDSPAFLAVPDGLDLAKSVEGVVVVARYGRTQSGEIRTVCEHLESIGAKVVGMIVNQSPAPKKEAYYYHQKGQQPHAPKKPAANPT